MGRGGAAVVAALALSVAWAANENVGGGALDKTTVVEKQRSAGVRETFARGERTFDEGWEFLLGDRRFNFCKVGIGAGGNDNGVASLLREDTGWTAVDLPHDWMLSMPVEQAGRNGFRAVGRSFPKYSVAWYRKHFSTYEHPAERPTVFLQFDGIYRDAMVWFNGVYLGRNDSGYIGCRFDVSDLVEYGGTENSVVVRVDASGTEGWWYEGAGIYRHVRLIVKGRDHIRPDSLLFRTLAVTNWQATVCASAEVVGDGKIVFELDGKKFSDRMTLAKPRLWSPEKPELYTLTARLVGSDGTVRDSVTRQVGIRTLVFDAARGLLVNGTQTKVKGVCCHADMGCVGIAVPDAMHDYRVRLLKEMGANAVRTSHNPPAPEFLDACDRGGILVMDETRCFSSTDEGLSQLRRLVLRDRNHPCVVTWSIGNEEHNVQSKAAGARIARRMRELAKSLAPDIAVTYGGNNGTCGTGANAEVDVRGVNYIRVGSRKDLPRGTFDAPDRYHADHPDQAIWGTEEASVLSTRGSRKDGGPKDVRLMKDGDSSVDNVRFPWVATAEQWWNYAVMRPWFAGSFAWTGFDYRGETRWPATINNFGIMDLCGFPKASYWYYRANWTERDVLHAWPDWTPGVTNLWVDSNCDEIELRVNGRSVAKCKGDRLHHLAFPVKYEPGEAMLFGMRGGRTVTYRMTTPGPGVKLTLTTDRPDYLSGGDAVVVNVQALDEKGNEAFDACDEVRFSCTGAGKIIGVGNGDPLSHEDDVCTNGWHRKLFNGKCQFVVRTDKAHGEIRLRAEFAEKRGMAEMTVKAWPKMGPRLDWSVNNRNAADPRLALADPYVLCENGRYYAYGTQSPDGIAMAESTDLVRWKTGIGRGKGGLALHKDDSFGKKQFWAPEVHRRKDGKYVMFYSAETHMCSAVADSPYGPFVQPEKRPFYPTGFKIDNTIAVDDGGTTWMFYAQGGNGEEMWQVQLTDDWLSVKPGTEKFVLYADRPWERIAGQISEGPSVVKVNGLWWLLYSVNDCRSPDYSVGFATAERLSGPWTKASRGNPVINRIGGLSGTGHGAPFRDAKGNWRYVFHAHDSDLLFGPRRTHVVDLTFGGTKGAPTLTSGVEVITCLMN